MKANRFVKNDDDAVSPVIAVILMVAITVVLAATVYVWVSGFGTSGSIKKFPQVVMKDDTTTMATGTIDKLAVLEHRGGDTINWADYNLTVYKNDVIQGAAYTTAATCPATPGATDFVASGSFAVGNKLTICEKAATAWSAGDELKLVVIDTNQNSIVYENTVIVN